MTRTLTAAFAAFGLFISTALASIITVGLLEGASGLPEALPPTAAVVVFLAGMALTGRVAVDVDPQHALRAVGATAVIVAIGGLVAARATESQGEVLEPLTIATLASGLFVLLGTGVLVTRVARTRRGPAQGGPTHPESG